MKANLYLLGLAGAARSAGPHARWAVRGATRLGLTMSELRRVLEGHDPTRPLLPYIYEDPRAHGCRAASELLVRHSLDDARHEGRGPFLVRPLCPGPRKETKPRRPPATASCVSAALGICLDHVRFRTAGYLETAA